MGPMGNGGTGDMKYRDMSNRVQGYGAYQQWGTGGMGHMGNGSHGQWDTGGMGHMGNEAHWGVWVQGYGHRGYGVQGVWAMWAMGIQGYGPHGQWGPWAICFQNIKKMSSCQKDVKLSKRCQMSKNETPRLWRRFTKKIKLTQ